MISAREYKYLTSASPRSILVFSGRYHIISNASLVNNCIMSLKSFKNVCNIIFIEHL